MTRLRRTVGPTISLFPFLAVLICMMGGLLVLLVIFSRAAGDAGRAAVQAALADVELERESATWRVDQLRGVRDRTAADLATARLQLAGAEENARALADELDRLVATVKALGAPSAQPGDDDLTSLEGQLRSARESLEKKRAESADRPPAYAVIPYQGTHGTHRRPLYVECCIDGVFLQPEGIRLGPADFEGPPGPGNPLASALRAAREHMARTARDPADPAQQPYPLLLVRPSGIMAYYAAREAIASWGSEFGYQLVDEDWTLAFPPADPLLRDVQVRAVEESRRRLQWLAEVRPAKPAARQPLYRAATTRGGIVSEGGPSVLGDQSRWEWTEQQASAGPRDGRSALGTGAGPGGGGTGSGTSGDGSGGDAPEGPGRPLVAGGDDTAAHGNGPVLGGQGGAGGQGTTGGAFSRATAASRSGEGPAGRIAAGGGGPGGDSSRGAAPGPGGQVGDRYASAAASAFAGGGATDGTPTAGDVARGGGAGDAAAGAAGGAAARAGATGAATAGGSAGGMAGGSGGQPMPGMLSPPAGSAGQPGAAAGGATVSLSTQRGSNWASFATQDRPIPITRPVRIECAADELRILADGSRRVETRVAVPGATVESVDALVEALREKVGRWGLAGDRMYWKPQLVLSAAAGGAGRRDDLCRLLADSGLETTTDTRGDEIRSLPPVGRLGYAAIQP
ncbi:MAG: hypothetical protein FJ309_07795 [Planctomycetes bacterium]|nr:hypothetical protein [Planctomycetota bacterium]